MDTTALSSIGSTLKRADAAERKIVNYRGSLPVAERERLALSLGEIIEQAKVRGIRKGQVVIKANIRPGALPEVAVNALNNFCILPDAKNKRSVDARLHAHPRNYLKLALAAAELMGMAREEAIIRLTERSNHFGTKAALDEYAFSPVETTLLALKSALKPLVKKHGLKAYFRETTAVGAAYKYDVIARETTWCQEEPGEPSTSCWPSTYLATIIKSSAQALFRPSNGGVETVRTIYAAEKVYLTLGWLTSGWVAVYLEFLPGLAARPLEGSYDELWFDSGYAGQTRSEGGMEGGWFRLVDGAVIQVPPGCDGNGLYRAHSRERFEPLNAQLLAETFLNSRLLQTACQTLDSEIDTSAVVSPPDSPLALMEATLLGRRSRNPWRKTPNFLEALETDMTFFTTSFHEWRRELLERARQDHLATLAKNALELSTMRARDSGVRHAAQATTQNADAPLVPVVGHNLPQVDENEPRRDSGR